MEVTDHEHPIARVVPFRAGVTDQLISEGRATEASGDLLDSADALGLPEATAGAMQLSAAVAELWANER